jgi:hypothetical protein
LRVEDIIPLDRPWTKTTLNPHLSLGIDPLRSCRGMNLASTICTSREGRGGRGCLGHDGGSLPPVTPPSLPVPVAEPFLPNPTGDFSLPPPTATTLPTATADLDEGRMVAKQVGMAMSTWFSSLKRSPPLVVFSLVSQSSTPFSFSLSYLLGF